MMRSLWTGAAGMKAQQTSVDTIANNLANVNTTGYKAQSTEFKSLLYQTLQTETTTSNGDPKPTTAQVGLGARVASLNSNFTQGAMLKSDNHMALCISGKGFYALRGADNEVYYSRAGDFGWALDNVEGERGKDKRDQSQPVIFPRQGRRGRSRLCTGRPGKPRQGVR